MISEIGLVFLMFLIGSEFDFTHLRDSGKTAARVVAGIVLPFALGILDENSSDSQRSLKFAFKDLQTWLNGIHDVSVHISCRE